MLKSATLTMTLLCASLAISPSRASTISCSVSCGPGGQYQVPSWSFVVDPGVTLEAEYYLWNPVRVTAVVQTLPGLSTATQFDTGHLSSGNDAGSDLANIYELHFSAGQNDRYKNKDLVLVFSAPTTLSEVAMEGISHFQSFDLVAPTLGGSIIPDGLVSELTPPPSTFGTLDTAATPLPATLPLLAGGLGALALIGKRRKRKASN